VAVAVEKGTQAADVLVVLAAGVELDSLAAGADDEEDSLLLAAGVSVLGLVDPLLELPERLSVL
jgi:hypothetical protein